MHLQMGLELVLSLVRKSMKGNEICKHSADTLPQINGY